MANILSRWAQVYTTGGRTTSIVVGKVDTRALQIGSTGGRSDDQRQRSRFAVNTTPGTGNRYRKAILQNKGVSSSGCTWQALAGVAVSALALDELLDPKRIHQPTSLEAVKADAGEQAMGVELNGLVSAHHPAGR